MKILYIGGTGNISAACVRRCVELGHDVYLLNRGQRPLDDFGIHGVRTIVADMNDENAVQAKLADEHFDVVANFIVLTPDQIERDIRLFHGKCGQYIFISSASVYQKPLSNPFITESTPAKNPFWDYSRDKIACEDAGMRAHRDFDFPLTIVRPALTYETVIPMALGSWDDFTLVERVRRGEPVVVHGDGSSLWTITHSEDFAKGFVGLLGNQRAIGETFHITSDEVLSWDQLYDAFGVAAGVGPVKKVHIPSDFIARLYPWHRGNLHGDKAVSKIFDNRKLKQAVPDYCATIPFQEGIKRTIQWFEAKAERQLIRPESNQMLDTLIARYNAVFDHLTPV